MPQRTELISIADAEALVTRAFTACDVPRDNAASVAAALVAAEAEGQVGHGFSRIADYAAQVRSGKIAGAARPVCEAVAPASLHIDAGNGFAYPALDLAVAEGAKTAREQGTAAITVARSHHCGALSVQVEKFAREGLIGLMVANSPPAMAPWGGKTPIFGTNPIAFAAPRKGASPLVIDLSLSRVARGKVMHARKSGTEIPLGWALDSDGQPTTDPEAALAGSMVPIGEAKGTALALMVEVLAAVLSGANPSANVSSFFTADGPPPGSGQFLLAIRPQDETGFASRLEAVLGSIAALDGARLPGSRRAEALRRARETGIEVPSHYLDATRAMADGNG